MSWLKECRACTPEMATKATSKTAAISKAWPAIINAGTVNRNRSIAVQWLELCHRREP